MRAVVLREAARAGLPIDEVTIDATSLSRVTAVFFTNARIGVSPATRLDGRALATRADVESLRATIEHGHDNNLTLELATVAYWYQSEPHKAFPKFPTREERTLKPEIDTVEIHRWRDAWRKSQGNGGALWGNERTIAKWSRFETSFTGQRKYENPLQEVDLRVTFTSPSKKTRTVDGFWDGGATWRVRFSPDEEGDWTYVTSANGKGHTWLPKQAPTTLTNSKTPNETNCPIRGTPPT